MSTLNGLVVSPPGSFNPQNRGRGNFPGNRGANRGGGGRGRGGNRGAIVGGGPHRGGGNAGRDGNAGRGGRGGGQNNSNGFSQQARRSGRNAMQVDSNQPVQSGVRRVDDNRAAVGKAKTKGSKVKPLKNKSLASRLSKEGLPNVAKGASSIPNTAALQQLLPTILQQRWNPSTLTLNLSEINFEPALGGTPQCSVFGNGGFLNTLFQLISSSLASCNILVLENNAIIDKQMARLIDRIAQSMPSLTALSLARNKIQRECLKNLTNLAQLKQLTNIKISAKADNPSLHQQTALALVKQLPKLSILDDVLVQFSTLPFPIAESYFPLQYADVVTPFLASYMSELDAAGSPSLELFFSPGASVYSETFIMGARQPRFDQIEFNLNRNLTTIGKAKEGLKVTLASQKLFVGAAQIAAHIRGHVRKHDSVFTADVFHHETELIGLTVNGKMMENDEGGQPVVRNYCRTLMLAPNPGGVQLASGQPIALMIVNESLHVGSWSKTVTLPIDAGTASAPVSNEQIVLQLMAVTGMNQLGAVECLSTHSYNYEAALADYTTIKAQNKIPAHFYN